MLIQELINKKRKKHSLTNEEIKFFVKGVTEDLFKDYEISALLMAIAINGMSDRETTTLTLEMSKSGGKVDLSKVAGITADKHSTGGVSDTTTLVIVPILASLNVKMAKMSGRGLGFTGGTADKLEAIDGFNTNLTMDEFLQNLKNINAAMITQTDELAIADKKLYALRDVTDTIESIPLIASSIMSKKLACGTDVIMLDVKFGEGAFMKTKSDAIKLAKTMITIGKNLGKKMGAIISSMEQPLGNGIGCTLEVRDAIEVLNGKDNRLAKVSKALCVQILKLAFGWKDKKAIESVNQVIDSKLALKKLAEIVKQQGGNEKIIFNPSLMKKSKYSVEILAEESGKVHRINSEDLGNACKLLGGGRIHKTDEIYHEVGIDMHVELNSVVKKGDKLVTVYYNKKGVDEILHTIQKAIKIKSKVQDVKYNPIYKILT